MCRLNVLVLFLLGGLVCFGCGKSSSEKVAQLQGSMNNMNKKLAEDLKNQNTAQDKTTDSEAESQKPIPLPEGLQGSYKLKQDPKMAKRRLTISNTGITSMKELRKSDGYEGNQTHTVSLSVTGGQKTSDTAFEITQSKGLSYNGKKGCVGSVTLKNGTLVTTMTGDGDCARYFSGEWLKLEGNGECEDLQQTPWTAEHRLKISPTRKLSHLYIASNGIQLAWSHSEDDTEQTLSVKRPKVKDGWCIYPVTGSTNRSAMAYGDNFHVDPFQSIEQIKFKQDGDGLIVDVEPKEIFSDLKKCVSATLKACKKVANKGNTKCSKRAIKSACEDFPKDWKVFADESNWAESTYSGVGVGTEEGRKWSRDWDGTLHWHDEK